MRDDREIFRPLGSPLPREVKKQDMKPKQVEGARKGVMQNADGTWQTDFQDTKPDYMYITPFFHFVWWS